MSEGLIGKLKSVLGIGVDSDSGIMATISQAGPITYDAARDLARHGDPDVRRAVAAREDTPPEILYYLADDPDSRVRRAIACNTATPILADLHLASDSDAGVRGGLAQRIVRLAPGLTSDEQDRLRRVTYEALMLLARDQITKVRQILAETLKDVADAPSDLIRQLAHDCEIAVASPILEFSPVLTDADLLEIIRTTPATAPGALSSISRRSNVTADVADAIAISDDVDAIAALLGNASAQIRESTLDHILDRAAEHEAWHSPLVNRPQLSARAAARIANIVAENLLKILNNRTDLPVETKAAVTAEMRRRIGVNNADMADFRQAGAPEAKSKKTTLEVPLQTALRMHKLGRLEESMVLSALNSRDFEFVAAALAVLADVSLDVVEKIVSSQSAKGMLALAWQAGLTVETAVQLQMKLAKITPDAVLTPLPSSKEYPLTKDEMIWQVDFFIAQVNKGKANGHAPKNGGKGE